MTFKSLHNMGFIFLVVFALSACSGGGSGGGSGDGTYSYDPSIGAIPPIQAFTVSTGSVFTLRATSLSGSFWFLVYDVDPSTAATSPIPIGFSTVVDDEYDNFSLVSETDQTLYVLTAPYDISTGYRYTLSSSSDHLTVNGSTLSGSTNDSSLYYSFDVEAGQNYEVQLTPGAGDVNIAAVSPNMDMSASLGSSVRPGSTADMLGFTAVTSGKYYIRVGATSVHSPFTLNVNTITTEPDLVVDITSVGSDSANVVINYTVYNNGIDASGSFDVAGWANAVSEPVPGTSGDAFTTPASIAGYGSTSGSFTIADASASGTAYVIADNGSVVAENDETNNISLGADWVITQPDLSVIIDSVRSDGTNVSINYHVTNNGSRSSGSFNVELWADSASTPTLGSLGDITKSHSSLAGGSTTYGYAVIANTQASGTVYASVDNTDVVLESDETNNVSAGAAWVITYPDLQVTIDSVSANGVEVTIDYTVTNVGDNSSGTYSVDFWADAANAPVVGMIGDATATPSTLGSGSSTSGSITVSSALTSGMAYAVVDTGSAVTETNEGNNVSVGSAWVASYPDLQVEIERVISDGVNAEVNYRVYNRGANDFSGIFTVDVWADAATAPVIGDVGTGSKTHDFTSYSLSTIGYTSGTVSIPTTAATAYAYVIVDSSNVYPETDETNNVSEVNNWAITTFSSDTFPIDIPDNDIVNGVSSGITLSGATTSISRVVVGLNIWHNSVGQIDIYLESPSGTVIELSTDNGGGGEDYGDSVDDCLFDDNAPVSILSSSVWPNYNQVYRPEQPLSGLNGEDANGTWTLHVYDDYSGTTGILRNWSIAVQ